MARIDGCATDEDGASADTKPTWRASRTDPPTGERGSQLNQTSSACVVHHPRLRSGQHLQFRHHAAIGESPPGLLPGCEHGGRAPRSGTVAGRAPGQRRATVPRRRVSWRCRHGSASALADLSGRNVVDAAVELGTPSRSSATSSKSFGLPAQLRHRVDRTLHPGRQLCLRGYRRCADGCDCGSCLRCHPGSYASDAALADHPQAPIGVSKIAKCWPVMARSFRRCALAWRDAFRKTSSHLSGSRSLSPGPNLAWRWLLSTRIPVNLSHPAIRLPVNQYAEPSRQWI